jgi:hypothetical protein
MSENLVKIFVKYVTTHGTCSVTLGEGEKELSVSLTPPSM